MKTRIKLFVTSLLLSAFYFSSNAQVTIDVGKEIYVCTGDSVLLPRVRVVTPSCIDSSLISCPTVWLNLNLYCGCDQLQYLGDSWDAEIYSGVSSVTPGFCPSQISNWSGGNGGLFTTGLFYNTSFGTSNFVVYHPSPADYSVGYSNLLFSSGGQIDTLKLIYTTGIELGANRLICAPLSNIQLTAVSPGSSLDNWTGGLGVFSPNNNISNPTYTPTSTEISNGFVDLIYTDSKIIGSCKSDTLKLLLNNSLTTNVTVDVGNTISTCGSSLPLNLTATGSNINQLTWYGHGTFSSSNTLSTNYSLSNDEIQTGYGSVAVIATDQNNCSITDTLNFNINTRVDILNDNTNNLYTTDKKEVIICATAGSTYNLSGIATGISNNVTWTSSGSGSFLNPNSTSTIYTFSSQDIQNNIVTVYFQSNGCNNPKDSLKIKINNITANLNFGNLPFFGTCNTTYSFPVNFSGVTYPWGNYCLLGYTTVSLDNNPITPDPNTGLYDIGPLSAGLHQIEVYGGPCNNLIGTHFIDIPSGIIGIQDTTVCEGGFVTLYGQGGSNYIWSGGIQDGVPFLPPGPGVYTYNLTGIDNCGVIGYDTITVTVIGAQNVFQILNTTLCSGSNSDPIQFFSDNNNYVNYYWDYGFLSGINVQPSQGDFFIPNGGPHFDSIQYIATNTTNQPQTITLHVNYGNFGGCGNTIQQQFVLYPEGNIDAGPDLSICQGTSVTLNGIGNNMTFSWDNNVQNGVSFTPTLSNVYTLTGIVSGVCTYTDQVTVTVNPIPIVDAGIDQSVCEGNSIILNGSGATTYDWNNGVFDGISFIPTTTTTYNVIGIDTMTWCIGSDQVTITVNPNPNFNFHFSSWSCGVTDSLDVWVNQPGTISTSEINNGINYNWSGNSYWISNTNSLPELNEYITFSFTNSSNGCTYTDSTYINTLQNFITDEVIDTTIHPCQSFGQLQLPNNDYWIDTSLNIPYEYIINNWNGNDFVHFDYYPNGYENTTLIGYTETPNGCLVDTVNITFYNSQYFFADTSGNNWVFSCGDSAIQLNGIQVNNADSMVWTSWYNGNSGSFNNSSNLNALYYPDQADYDQGYVILTLQAFYPHCLFPDTSDLYIALGANVYAGNDTTICAHSPIVINSSGVNYSSWNSGNIDGDIVILDSGNYQFIATGYSGYDNFCISTDTLNILVNALPNLDAGLDVAICFGDSVLLNANSNSSSNITWSNGEINSSYFNPLTSQSLIASVTENNCSNSDTLTVTVYQNPIVDAGPNQSVCGGNSVTLTGSGASAYSWNNGITNGISFIPTTTNTYSVSGTNTTTGCIGTDQVLVTVNPIPIIDAGPNQSICAGNSVTLNASGANTYTWNNGVTNGISFVPTVTNTYSVTGNNTSTGCTGTDQVTVTVNPNTNSTINETSVGNYTWSVTGQTYTETGVYNGVIPNQYGCDSIITLNLTITTGSLEDISKSEHFTLSPNPNNGQFTVNVGSSLIGKSYKLMTTDGMIIRQNFVPSENFEINIQNQISTGIYLLEIGNNIKRIVINDK
jgi:hypothetical protein